MKLLENSTLDTLSSTISIGATDCILDMKLEAYSCKMVQSDKKLWKCYDNGNNLAERHPLSPPDDFLTISASPIGHSARMRHLSELSCSGSDNDNEEQAILVDSISRRTLFDLLAVLNCSYPDYDFSNVQSNCFSLVPTIDMVMDNVDGKFAATVHNYTALREELWNAVDTEIQPSDCKIYGFKSNYSGDPFSEDGCMWCLNFFFYNKILKRLLLLSCRALAQNRNEAAATPLWDVDDVE